MTTSAAKPRARLRALVAAMAFFALAAPALAKDPEDGNFDARPEGDGTTPAAVQRAGDRLRERLGRFGALSRDDRTGTLRSVGRLDGFLTGPSGRDHADVALDYVRDNASAFGLDGDDLEGVRLVDRSVIDGLEHLSWEQRYRGIPAVDAELEAAVTGAGQLVALTGPPAADLAVRSIEPAVGAQAAYTAARDSVGAAASAPAIADQRGGAERETTFADGGRASLALYRGASGYRLAWRVLAPVSSTGVYDVLVDARSGAAVRRANRVNFANAKAFRYTPAHAAQEDVILDPWLDASGTLSGPNAHAFADVHDVVPFRPGSREYDFTPEAGSNVLPVSGNYDFPLQTVEHQPEDRCMGMPATPPPPPTLACTWNPLVADSWEANRSQSVTQLFYFVNTFHDHLRNDPDIAFVEGGFERTVGPLRDPDDPIDPGASDPVLAQALDGADDDGSGLPDGEHVNNANFLTLPDGLPGLMQMYLWKPPFGGYDGANDATVAFHEYTHGLSNRLIADSEGYGALNTAQAGALGEGWSDFYAMDYLEAEGLEVDDAGTADVHVGGYLDNGTGTLLRWQGIDCTPASSTSECEAPPGGAGTRGFTYADFGNVVDGAEVHSDGEIWGQTLWSLRAALIAQYGRTGADSGIARTRNYVTRAMRLAPPEPSFLDIRNAMLQASPDEDDDVLWDVFAARGMGYFAGSDGSDDVTPKPDFTDPADLTASGTISGTVVDENDSALAGATVGIAGFDTGLGPQHTDQTGSDGTYSIADVPTDATHSYPAVRARKAAFAEGREADVEVAPDPQPTVVDFVLARDWSSATPAPGRATVASFTGPDNTSSGCGPGGLIDDDPATVWGSSRDDVDGQEIVIELAAPVDVGRVAIDPAAGCGDDDSAALGAYQVLGASSPGGPFRALGAADAFVAGDIGTLTDAFNGSEPGIRWVKLHAKAPQGTSGSGARFLDVAEIHVARVPGSPVGAAVNTGGAEAIGTGGATLTGSAVPHGAPAQVFFEYGTTTSYGGTVSAGDTPAGEATVAVTAGVGGLEPSTTYHFRLVALRNGRRYEGGDATFVTAPAPPPPAGPQPEPPQQTPPQQTPPQQTPPQQPPPQQPPAVVRPTLLLDGSLTASRKGLFKVNTFFGDAAPVGDARFTVLNARRKPLARATTPVRVGRHVVKTLQLSRRGRRAIKPGRSKTVTLELRLPSGQKLFKTLKLARKRR